MEDNDFRFANSIMIEMREKDKGVARAKSDIVGFAEGKGGDVL